MPFDQVVENANAVTAPRRGFESALLKMLRGIEEYCAAHSKRYDSPIGDDYLLGEAVKDMLEAYHTLLNGERGRLSGAYLDTWFRTVAKDNGLKLEE